MSKRQQDLLNLCNFNNFLFSIVETNLKLNGEGCIDITFSKGSEPSDCLKYLTEMGEKLYSSFFQKSKYTASCYKTGYFPFSVDKGNLQFDKRDGCYHYKVKMCGEVTHNFSVLAVNTRVKGVTQVLAKMFKLSPQDVVGYVSSERLTNEEHKEYAYCASFFDRGKHKYRKEIQTKFIEKFHAAVSEMCDGVCKVPSVSDLMKIEGNKVYIRHFSDEVVSAISQFTGWSIVSRCEYSNKEDKNAERFRNMFIDSIYESTEIVISGYERARKAELGKDDLGEGFVIAAPIVEYIDEQGNKKIRTLTPDEAQAINGVINEHHTKANPSAERLEFVEWDKSIGKFIVNINDDEISSEIGSWLIENCSINAKERSLSVDLTPRQREVVRSPSKESASFSFPVAGTSKQPIVGMQTGSQPGASFPFGGFKITTQQPGTGTDSNVSGTSDKETGYIKTGRKTQQGDCKPKSQGRKISTSSSSGADSRPGSARWHNQQPVVMESEYSPANQAPKEQKSNFNQSKKHNNRIEESSILGGIIDVLGSFIQILKPGNQHNNRGSGIDSPGPSANSTPTTQKKNFDCDDELIIGIAKALEDTSKRKKSKVPSSSITCPQQERPQSLQI